jgi:carboxylesterase type B
MNTATAVAKNDSFSHPFFSSFVFILCAIRYMPPVTPSTWKNTRLADHFSPVCPQSVPVSDTGMEALLEMPRGRLAQLRRMKSMLTNHSEDCLYLNMYVPREGEFES